MIDIARKRRRRVIEVELTPLFEPALSDATRGCRSRPPRPCPRSSEPEARAVLVLHFYLDLPLPRVAEMLGIPNGTAKSRLHRSLGILRSHIAIDEVAAANLEGRTP